MASLPFTHFFWVPRCHPTRSNCPSTNFFPLQGFRLQTKWPPTAVSRKNMAESSDGEEPNENDLAVKKRTTRSYERVSSQTRKKATMDAPEDITELAVTNNNGTEEEIIVSVSSGDSKKTPRRTRRKAAPASAGLKEDKTAKKVRRRRKTKYEEHMEGQNSGSDVREREEFVFVSNVEDESDIDLQLDKDDGDDISHTYGWPPLVCCFGAAQHAFVPSGRPANRLIDYEIHERNADALWEPEKFIRAPGGSAGSVAIALATLGGKVAFMGKLGDDEYGQAMLYYMNVNNVQTRSVCIDSKKATAISLMKLAKRGHLRATCVKPCAEDSLSKSEINIAVLKEAKMFYFSTHSLLEQSMRSVTLQAMRISKKLGATIFYDLNLPLPLWHSGEETKLVIQQVWNMADVIEVTKQELEFLCGIKPAEEFNTKNNARSKFVHYGPEVVAPLWHENLKVLFVTNGTSKIHYYTKELNGAVRGMEDAPITPFTSDMSASGDGIVAALMRMLTVQPHLITDKGFLERTIKYAIDCGVIDQWLLGRERGFPPKEDMEEVEPDPNGIRSITEKEYRTLVPAS